MGAGDLRRNDLGLRGRTLSSAIASLLQLAAGQQVLTWACGADELPGKGSETEGGEALAVILQHPLSAWDIQFFPIPFRNQWKAVSGDLRL